MRSDILAATLAVASIFLFKFTIGAQEAAATNTIATSRNHDPGAIVSGSIAGLLHRLSAQSAKALPVNTIPDDLKKEENGTVKAAVSAVNSVVHPGEPVVPNPKLPESIIQIKRQRYKRDTTTPEQRRDFIQKMSGDRIERRFVWGTSIIQDPGVTEPVATEGGITQPAVPTPTAILVGPTFPPQPIEVASTAAAVLVVPRLTTRGNGATATENTLMREARFSSHASDLRVSRIASKSSMMSVMAVRQLVKKEDLSVEKRYVWGTSILEDPGVTPPGGQPTAGGISYPALPTPTATLVAPTFPPPVVPGLASGVSSLLSAILHGPTIVSIAPTPATPSVAPAPAAPVPTSSLPVAPVIPLVTSDEIAVMAQDAEAGVSMIAPVKQVAPVSVPAEFLQKATMRWIPNPKHTAIVVPTSAPVKIVGNPTIIPHPGEPMFTKTIEINNGIFATVYGMVPSTVPSLVPRGHGSNARREHQRMVKRQLKELVK